MALPDIQGGLPAVAMPIDRVGVSGLAFRLRLRDKTSGQQEVAAVASLAVNLPAQRRGAHMSRLVEALDAWQDTLGCQSVRLLLEDIQKRLDATAAFAEFQFSWLSRRTAPVSGLSAIASHNCTVAATLTDAALSFELGIAVPVMTVCPCSLAISTQGAHCQRAMVQMSVACRRFIWLEDLIAMAEAAGSAPVYPLLKRPDEKYVTELAFSRSAFVEDVARGVAHALANHPHVLSYKVHVESMESIHNHNAFAVISSG